MPAAVNVFGPAAISVDVGSGLTALGYTRQGAEIRDQAFWIDVPGDEYGGDQGPPIDVQYLGEIARIRLELTKWDETVAANLRARLAGDTEGTPGTPGTLMFGGDKCSRLLINPTTGPWNFPRAFLRDVWEMNKGTKYSTLVLEYEAHKSAAGVLYNAVAT